MKIAIDLDDVLSDTMPTLLDFYNDNYSPKISFKDLKSYSYWGFLGKSREEANEKYFAFVDSERYISPRAVFGAKEAVDKLAEEHELYIVTGRPRFSEAKTRLWVENNFPGKFKKICFTNERMDRHDNSPYWGRPKAAICEELGIGVIIDDILEYVRDSEKMRVFLLDRFWNQGPIPSHMTRVRDWEEIVELLSKKTANK